MPRQNIKTPIVNWLAKDDNAKLTVEKAFKKFQKDTKLEVREKAFIDYHKLYGEGKVAPKPLSDNPANRPEPQVSLDDIKITVFNTDDKKRKDKPTEEVFIPFKTGKSVDMLISKPGGVMKGTTTIVDGPPGVGKSTVVYDIQNQIHLAYPKAKTICINSEMKVIDLDFDRLEKPWMGNVDFCLLSDRRNIPNMEEGRDIYEYTKIVLKKIFSAGYDVIFVDSFEDIIEKLKDYCGMSRGEAESFLLGLFDTANDGIDNNGVKSAIVAINQVTKGGVFVGSNKIKHRTTAMLHLAFDDRGERCAEYSKNRRGKYVNKKMYYTLDEKGEVIWDVAAFEAMEHRSKLLKDEKDKLGKSSENFFKTFSRVDGDETIAGKIKTGNMSVDDDGLEEDEED